MDYHLFINFKIHCLTVNLFKLLNRANKKLSNVVAWELSKQAAIDARQKKYEVINRTMIIREISHTLLFLVHTSIYFFIFESNKINLMDKI